MRSSFAVGLMAAIITSGCAFRQHARFCGPGYPQMPDDWTLTQRRAELERIAPFDDIDAVCKAHDLCYIDKGASEEACDSALIESVKRLELRTGCDNVAGDITTWFIAFHPSVTKGNRAQAFSDGAMKVIASPLIGGMVVLHGVLQLFGRAGRDEPCCDRTNFLSNSSGPCYPKDASPARLRVMEALVPYAAEPALYFESLLPAPQELAARSQTRVPPDEPTLAFLFDSTFGLTSGVVFTERAMYFKPMRGPRGSIPLNEIRDIVEEPFGVTVNGSHHVHVTGTSSSTLASIIRAARDAATFAPDP